jgi:hypothetical protein
LGDNLEQEKEAELHSKDALINMRPIFGMHVPTDDMLSKCIGNYRAEV